MTSTSTASPNSFWGRYRQEIGFLLIFVVVLGGSFTFLSWNPINEHVVEPFTGLVAKASGVSLNLLGQGIRMKGTLLRGERFTVNIRNGCNGVETMVIFLAAVVAFPASWRSRALGLVIGVIAIQAVNLLRVIALFLTGAYFPDFFDSSHTVVWQTIVVLAGVLVWVLWAARIAVPPQRESGG